MPPLLGHYPGIKTRSDVPRKSSHLLIAFDTIQDVTPSQEQLRPVGKRPSAEKSREHRRPACGLEPKLPRIEVILTKMLEALFFLPAKLV